MPAGLHAQMALLGRLHPLLIHFPIALVLSAVAAEGAALVGGRDRWRAIAAWNVRCGAVFALASAVAGWRLAATLALDPTPLLAWHRWSGTVAAGLTIAAAAASGAGTRSSRALLVYRIGLAGAGALVAFAGHLGGLLVWGAEFLRP